MATLSRGISGLTNPHGGDDPAGHALALCPLALSWTISPTALLASPPVTARLNGLARRLRSTALQWSIEAVNGETVTAHARLLVVGEDGRTDILTLTPPDGLTCAIESTADHQLTHFTISGVPTDPALTVTARGATVLYAATDAFVRLGLPGGVYDGPEVEPACH